MDVQVHPDRPGNPDRPHARDAERQIFWEQIGKHPPDDAHRAAGIDHVLEEPQHLVEDQQHRRKHQRAEQWHGYGARKVAVD